MMDQATHIRRIEALLAKTVERGAFPHEAESAQRLARRLIERHGLQAHFNGHAGQGGGAAEYLRGVYERERSDEGRERARRQREWDEHHEEMMRAHNERMRKMDEAAAQARAREDAWRKSQEEWAESHERNRAERRREAARRGVETRRRKERAAKLQRYRGVAGTVQAVRDISRIDIVLGSRGPVVVNEKHLAQFLDISENAAHGRLWRAVQAGLLRKVEGGYVNA